MLCLSFLNINMRQRRILDIIEQNQPVKLAQIVKLCLFRTLEVMCKLVIILK